MSTKDPSFETAMRALAALANRQAGEPPTVEDLLSYQAGELPEEEAERVADYLATHPAYAQMALAAAELQDAAAQPSTEAMDSADLDRSWETFRERLETRTRQKEVSPQATGPVREVGVGHKISPQLAPALAAGLIVAVLGLLAAWLLPQGKEVAQNLEPVTLDPVVRVTRSVPFGRAGSGDLFLTLTGITRQVAYELAIFDASEHRVEMRYGLRPVKTGVLTLVVSGLAPGRYRIEVRESGDPQEAPMNTYVLVVEDSGIPEDQQPLP